MTLTIQRAAKLRLLLEEPLTKPLGSFYTREVSTHDDAVTLVQSPRGFYQTERLSHTAMGRARASAHARLAAMEAAAGSSTARAASQDAQGVRDSGHARFVAAEAAAISSESPARTRGLPPRAADRDAQALHAARLALRRDYASHKLSVSWSGAVRTDRGEHVRRRRSRAAWLWATGLGTCSMFVAYAVTLWLVPKHEGSTALTDPATGCWPVETVSPEAASSHAAGASNSRPVNRPAPTVKRYGGHSRFER